MAKIITVGLTEQVIVRGPKTKKKVMARMDTGATKNSLDVTLAANLSLGPIVKATLIKSASGASLRPVVEAEIELKGKRIKGLFTLADRSHMKYKVLIGQNTLKKGFMIDPSKE